MFILLQNLKSNKYNLIMDINKSKTRLTHMLNVIIKYNKNVYASVYDTRYSFVNEKFHWCDAVVGLNH